MTRFVEIMFLVVAIGGVGAWAEAPVSLVANGGFERGMQGWSVSSQGSRLVPSPRGGQCVEVKGGYGVAQQIYVAGMGGAEARPRTFTVAVDVKAEGIEPAPGRGYAFAAVYLLALQGELKWFHDFVGIPKEADWKRCTHTFKLVPGAEVISLRGGIFNAKGTAWFDNWTLVEGPQAYRLDEVAEPRPQTGTAKGVVGIFRQEGFPAKGTASSPEALAEMVKAGGIEARFLSLSEMCDPSVLKPSSFDIVVLPYGESFPGAARDMFSHYLRSGGDFISMGGYAFNNLLFLDGGRWMNEKDFLAGRMAEALRPEKSLLFDGGFEKEETQGAPIKGMDMQGKWRRDSQACTVVAEQPAEGKRCAKVVVAVGGTSETKWGLHLPAKQGRQYRISAFIKAKDISPAGFAYLALYQFGADGRLIKHRDFAQVKGTADWKRYEYDFLPEPGVAVLYIKCGLYMATGAAWFDGFHLADITGLTPRPMNTSTGRPHDGLAVSPAQIGAFDADYRLKRVRQVKAAPGQHIFPESIALGAVKGWAASGVRGTDDTRWLPLLTACDRYGRERGSAGSLLIHYNGFYNGSAWAYFGVEDADLFAKGNPAMASALQDLVRFMVRGVYLRNLNSDFASYPPGSPVKLDVTVENRGARALKATVKFSAQRFFEMTKEVSVAENSCETIRAEFALPPAANGLCPIKAELVIEGKTVDEMESAIVALSPAATVGGPPLRFRENYFRYGERPLFLFGSDNYSNVYKSSTEGPLWWAREHAASRDFGFEIYENLQYSNPGHRMEEADWRSFQGMAQLTQQYGLVFMPCLLVGHNVAVPAEEIAAESAQCGGYAQRLKDTPRLLWYINGDYQLRPNEIEALKEKKKNTGRWDDAGQMDRMLLYVKLMTDWNRAHVAAIRKEDPAHPITSEYYQIPFSGMDLRLTIDGQDVSNIGYFDKPEDDVDKLPLRLRWNDLRAQGKSVGLGEYGVKTHPAWAVENGGAGYHIVRTEEQAKQLFMAVAHYTFGMGGSKVQNWCLRDANQNVFPWGVFYPGPLIPKDVAYVHRNLSLLMRMFAPEYRAPALTVLLCDNMRLGNFPNLGTESGYRAFAALLALHADFNVLSDWHIKEAPATTKVMIYPAGLCPGDENFDGLCKWVEAGGRLLLTGDCGYHSDRTHTRAERLKRLAGLEWIAANYPPEERGKQAAGPMVRVKPSGAQVLAAAPNGDPLRTRYDLGKGRVYFCADPVELSPPEDEARIRDLYRWFLKQAEIQPMLVSPDDPEIHVAEAKTRTGAAHVVFNTRKGDGAKEVTLSSAAGAVALKVKDRYPALAGVSGDGRVRVLGAYQGAKVGGDTVLEAGGMATLVALDGADLRSSEAIMALPFSEGRVALRSPQRAWRRPMVLLGDINEGRFRVLETLRPPAGNDITIDFDEDRATLFALVCEADEEGRWREFVGGIVCAPEGFEGY